MATMGEISAAINLIDVKKENLQKSFLRLQSQSPSSFTFPLKWADFDSYFTTLHSSLQSQFNLLQTFYPSPDTTTVLVRPELKSFCENSDGLGLKRFIALAPDRLSILAELPDAYRCAPDAAAMVLDAMAGFHSPGCKGTELRLFRSGCLIMLEGLMQVKPDITIEMKDKAMEMAVQWNQKRVSSCGPVKAKEQNALGFLLLVGAYGLIDRFIIDDLIDCFLVIGSKRQTIDLCRQIIPENNINDLIQTLINKDMHVTAVNFSIELQKTDEFPPVGLLEERKLMSMRVIEETRKNNDVTMKEINTLKSIIECIDENHLQSEYPKDSVVELVNKLENEVENSKQAFVSDWGIRRQPSRRTVLKKQMLLKSKKPKLNKFTPTVEFAVATPIQNVMPIEEPNSHESDLLPDHFGECHNSPLGSGPTAPYASPSESPYGSTGANNGYSFYVPQLHPTSDYNSNGWISD